MMIRQRDGAREGSQAGERPELGDLGGESGLAIIGQELVPATTNPAAEFFDAPSSRTPLASSLHRSSATDAVPNGEIGGESQLVVSSRVFSVAIDTPETPQSAPVGQPQSFGPVPRRLMNESSQENGNQEDQFDGAPIPLFDEQQLRRFAEIYSQAPLVFPAVPNVRRPDFLEQDGRRVGSHAAANAAGLTNRPRMEVNSGNAALNQMASEILALRQAQEMMTKENLELRAKLIQTGMHSRSEGEEFNTPDRVQGEVKGRQEDVRWAGNQFPGVPADRYGVCQGPEVLRDAKECQDPKVPGSPREFHSPLVPGDPKVCPDPKGAQVPSGGSSVGPSDPTVQVLLKVVEGMTNLQKQIMDNRDREKDVEAVRNQAELPPLPPWSSTTGPVDLSDWLVLIEPIMADLTSTSGEWWNQLISECQEWYTDHLQLQPLDRVAHDPSPSKELTVGKWVRLERRASTLLLMAIPGDQREELISAKRLTAMKIICHLMVLYQPGGLAEKELILRQLESPPEASSLSEALQGLRKWGRWRTRATDLGVQEPDPFLLLKGLNRLTRKSLEQHRDLSFRISLARSTLQVDSTPTSRTITSFALHLIAEFEQVVHSEISHNKKKDQPEPKVKTFRPTEPGPSRERPQNGREEGDQQREFPPCRFFLTDSGCRKGRNCKFGHDLRDEKRRCYHCGSPEHLAPQCDKGTRGGTPKQKASRGPKDQSKENVVESGMAGDTQSNASKDSMSSLLEEANKLIKAMNGSEGGGGDSSSPPKGATTGSTANLSDQSRTDMMERLQQQLNALRQKTLKISLSRMSNQGFQGLIDSGATHPLRPLRHGEDQSTLQKVDVTLADGKKTQLMMNHKGTMISPSNDIEPIIPMGQLQSVLKCKMIWVGLELQVLHPIRGKLPVTCDAGCPMLPRALALDLIEEIEVARREVSLRSLSSEQETQWLRDLINTHPSLRDLPEEIKFNLMAVPGSWNDLPYNRRLRKRMKRDGVIVHLYAGPDKGYTLDDSLKRHVGSSHVPVGRHRLIEIDIKRGDAHDMLHMNGVYSGLLRCAFEGKLDGIIGGPNCRSRSILRHRPLPGCPNAPRPVRAWNGEEFGKRDLSPEEKAMVLEDDTLMMRMIVLFLVSSYVKRAENLAGDPWFLLEQPADPVAKNEEVVSWWRTPQWKSLVKEFGFQEVSFDQYDLGGECNKMTTLGGNLVVDVDQFKMSRKPNFKRVQDSKSLSRWAPKMMDAISTALIRHVFKQEPCVSQLSWKDHIQMGHVPYRRDCKVCQETLQLQRPHRRIKHPISGVLSLDTAGPLELSKDLEKENAKYLLIGALTWLVHRDVPLREALPEDPLPDDAPSLDILETEEEVEEEEEKSGQLSPSDALGNVEDATRDVGNGETEPDQEAEKEEYKDFEIQVFRMVIPMPSKKAPVVLQTAIEMILRLRANGYPIHQVHCDRGREFRGPFQKWMKSRGILVTQTPGADPQSNGRAEKAVQCIKQHVRRVLHAAGVSTGWWALAARYVNEVLAVQRLGRIADFPPFLTPVQCKKRYWKTKTLDPTVDTMRYLFPAWDSHGHWVLDPDDKPVITRYVMKPIEEARQELRWQAVEPEVEDQQTVRRRIRGKTTIRSLDVEDQPNPDEVNRMMFAQVLEQEMIKIPGDDFEQVKIEIPVLEKLKKAALHHCPEEEILQTKIIGQDEVRKDWNIWKGAAEEEVASLLEEKKAMVELGKSEVEEVVRKAQSRGQQVEFIPSKLVFTKKPAEKGLRRKVRWVVCGNYEAPTEGEQTYSGGADITALRVMIAFAVQYQWSGSTVDIKTAFLNADFNMEQGETILLVRPPQFFVDLGFMAKDKCFLPQKAVYGFRRSPRLWGLCRDRHLADFVIEAEEGILHLVPLQSEPNLWKIVETKVGLDGQAQLRGLLLTYVDDIFIVADDEVRAATLEKIMQTWSTSPPDKVEVKPIKFLGMNISKVQDESTGKDVWYVNQDSYIKDLLEKTDDPCRQVPISRDQALMEPEPSESVTPEKIKLAQQHVGELLWLVTRSRPDLMFAVACMGANLTKAPSKVSAVAAQCRGYLKSDEDGGLRFAYQEPGTTFNLEAYSDASFSPTGGPSHGCLVILLNGAAVFWRSGKQQLITLSTAECELVEFVNTITAGESIAVVLQELTTKIRKIGWCDSRAALGILENEGGNWRTRHLRFRSAYVRQLVLSGEWLACHIPGSSMIADLGTKALSSVKIHQLRMALGMQNPPKVSSEVEKEELMEQLQTARTQVDPVRAQRLLQLLSILVVVEKAKGQDGPDFPENEDEIKNWIPLWIYTFCIIGLTMVLNWCLGWIQERLSSKAVVKKNALEDNDVDEDLSSSRDEVQGGSELPLPRPADLPQQDQSPLQVPAEPKGLPVPKPPQRCPQQGAQGQEGDQSRVEPAGPKGRGGGVSMILPKEKGKSPSGAGQPAIQPKPKPPASTSTSSSMAPLVGIPKSKSVPAVQPPALRSTRFGAVYHAKAECSYLKARTTGTTQVAQFCQVCRSMLESQNRPLPVIGDEVKMRSFASTYHAVDGCNESTRLDSFRCCSSCGTRF